MHLNARKRLVCLGVVFIIILTHLQAAEVHVSPNGNDASPGTVAKPLATVAEAQRMARTLAGREPVTV